ncbi:MAG: hypothetical protein ACJAT0_001782 [Nonlabens sp.]|jgi:hypothetical protein|uniref:ice-binding family protein n=1 Tax=Nonlabens sp. TaxID=1888209 RepID=UPI0039E527AF
MKNNVSFLLLFVISISSSNLYAQVGIGTRSPDVSAVLDIQSQNKGMLMPRLTSVQRDLIEEPANGLMIFNTTLNDAQINLGDAMSPLWSGTKTKQNLINNVVSQGDNVISGSINNAVIPDMSLTPQVGTYSLTFNANQMYSESDQQFTAAQGNIDVNMIYQDLRNFLATDTTHIPAFGNDETLQPGVYDLTGAFSLAGILTLDGRNDSDSLFIIRSTGAFSAGASGQVVLINGAEARNVYWVSDAAMDTGANSNIKGSLVSGTGAISLGADARLEGRIFTNSGALSIGANSIINMPLGVSVIDLRILSSFAMFTASGAIASGANSTIDGNIATSIGALTTAGQHYGEKYSAATTLDAKMTANNTTYSIYQNGEELVNTSRTIHSMTPTLISLHAIISILDPTDTIEIRWKVSEGESMMQNRSLSLIHF